MHIEDVTLGLFAACNSLRLIAYIPQIRTAAMDKNGASAISFTTWLLFLVAHVSTVAYALINRADLGLAACFTGNAVCCLAILAVTYAKRCAYARQQTRGVPPHGQPDIALRPGSAAGADRVAHRPIERLSDTKRRDITSLSFEAGR